MGASAAAAVRRLMRVSSDAPSSVEPAAAAAGAAQVLGSLTPAVPAEPPGAHLARMQHCAVGLCFLLLFFSRCQVRAGHAHHMFATKMLLIASAVRADQPAVKSLSSHMQSHGIFLTN
jgi:hypothetical protein